VAEAVASLPSLSPPAGAVPDLSGITEALGAPAIPTATVPPPPAVPAVPSTNVGPEGGAGAVAVSEGTVPEPPPPISAPTLPTLPGPG
jgi:hypothetical protein